MIKQPIPNSKGFKVPPELWRSFYGPPTFNELRGPGALIRLVQFEKRTYEGFELKASSLSSRPGKPTCWIEEEVFVDLWREARFELNRQQAAAKQPFSTPLPILIGNYVRHCLRMDLAVCKDWTNDFDGFVRFRLMPGDEITALVATVARQPAYSAKHPQHKAVLANKIYLSGGITQYVIDFDFPANRSWGGRILGPFRF